MGKEADVVQDACQSLHGRVLCLAGGLGLRWPFQNFPSALCADCEATSMSLHFNININLYCASPGTYR